MKRKLVIKLICWAVLFGLVMAAFLVLSVRNAKGDELKHLRFDGIMRITNTDSPHESTCGGGFALRSSLVLIRPFIASVELGMGVRSTGVDQQFEATEKAIIWGAFLAGIERVNGAVRYLGRVELPTVGPMAWLGGEIDAFFFFLGFAGTPSDSDAWKLDCGVLLRF